MQITHMRGMYAINYSSVEQMQQLCFIITGYTAVLQLPLRPLPRASAMRKLHSASVHITDGQFYGVSDIKDAAMNKPCLGMGWKGEGERWLQGIPASYIYSMYDYIIEWSLKSSGIISINQLLT